MAKKEVQTDEVESKQDNGLAAEVRRLGVKVKGILNWMETVHNLDIDGDGKVGNKGGFIRLSVMGTICVVGIIAAIAMASLNIDVKYDGDTTYGTYTLISDEAGATTLTVDKIVADTVSATSDFGAVTTGVSTITVSTEGTVVKQTTITMADLVVVVPKATCATNDIAGGSKIADFPAGRIAILGVTVDNMRMATNAGMTVTNVGWYALGTVVGAGDLLSTTEVDLAPATAFTAVTNFVDLALAATAQFDGTATAKDIYANVLMNSSAEMDNLAHTNLVSGTIKITWINLGDYVAWINLGNYVAWNYLGDY